MQFTHFFDHYMVSAKTLEPKWFSWLKEWPKDISLDLKNPNGLI